MCKQKKRHQTIIPNAINWYNGLLNGNKRTATKKKWHERSFFFRSFKNCLGLGIDNNVFSALNVTIKTLNWFAVSCFAWFTMWRESYIGRMAAVDINTVSISMHLIIYGWIAKNELCQRGGHLKRIITKQISNDRAANKLNDVDGLHCVSSVSTHLNIKPIKLWMQMAKTRISFFPAWNRMGIIRTHLRTNRKYHR